MKLAAIYNVWDGVELLPKSMECLKGSVDIFILVWQKKSNYGEKYNPMDEVDLSGFDNVKLYEYEPVLVNDERQGRQNEARKRNIGIQLAQTYGCTHFLHLDCDEFYLNFASMKQEYLQSGHKGSVCRILTYFKSPTLRLENYDNYYVPFIHQLGKGTIAGMTGYRYPYYVDPTRNINTEDVMLMQEPMLHFSWVRRNIERKIRNSSARKNIEKSQLYADFNHPDLGPGYYLKDYGQKLVRSMDIFNLSPLFD